MNPDVTSKDMKNMSFLTAYFSSKRPRDVDVSLESYVDADFANCVDDRHSISGYAFFLPGGLIGWQSRSQSTVALSTMEAEYMAAATATQIVLKEGNNACISFSDHPRNHRNSKLIEYRHQRRSIGNEFIVLNI